MSLAQCVRVERSAITMRSLIAITSSVVRAENNVRSLPDRLSPGGVVRSGYETNRHQKREESGY